MASKCASKTLFVGNLHASLEENDLLEIFKPFGRIIECCKRWCHYGFIQFATEDEAKLAFSNLNGSKVRGRPMRIEFQRKKIRNIQALIEAEVGSKAKGQHGFDSFSYFSLVLKSITNVDQNSRCDKNNNKNSRAMYESSSIGSSCSSPLSQREDTASPAIRLFRSINSSNTIYVQPSDIIIPLNEGDYTEYKLFPSGDTSIDCSQHPLSTILKNWNNSANESNELYSPPISPASSDASCSNSSSLVSSPRSQKFKIGEEKFQVYTCKFLTHCVLGRKWSILIANYAIDED
ncbi:polyadenylate-binding 7 [Brachionus plicatilis]|uniref:Polyadenylate-binding 7 n=1 Tax=Brachionus plicatilis TaxID=10195 RepID=A0A3M7T978_BRAPC|nr:polyadenylate-binding 7 [Brachionus plicatilis]